MIARPEVVRVSIKREALTAEKVPALRELFHLERLPLADSAIEIELKGVPTAVVNAIRRAATDEMPGRALQVPADGFDTTLTTEAFMLPQFVNQRISLVPLRPQIPADIVANLEFKLDVANQDATLLSVYTGDLEVVGGAMPEPLFNPTFKLATVQPGKRLVINKIKIATGVGRGPFMVARLAALRHLDIPEYSVAETHDEGGVAVDLSGYKVSSMVADPRHHILSAVIPATTSNPAEVRAVFADACANIRERLQLVVTSVERRAEAQTQTLTPGFASRGILYTVVQLEGGLSEGILQIPGETHTIGELLRRAVFDLSPDIANVSYIVNSHEHRLRLSLRHASEDVTKLLLTAARNSIAVIETIQRGIMGAR